jgi:hypothetical protein
VTSNRDRGLGAEGLKLPGRNTVKRKVDEREALAELSAQVRDLVRRLRARQDYEVLHGASQTVFNYRGQGIGGIDRGKSHGYLSQVFAVGSVRDRIRALGFQFKKMPSPGDAYKNHGWWQIDLPDSVDAFAGGLTAFEAVVDQELTRLGD